MELVRLGNRDHLYVALHKFRTFEDGFYFLLLNREVVGYDVALFCRNENVCLHAGIYLGKRFGIEKTKKIPIANDPEMHIIINNICPALRGNADILKKIGILTSSNGNLYRSLCNKKNRDLLSIANMYLNGSMPKDIARALGTSRYFIKDVVKKLRLHVLKIGFFEKPCKNIDFYDVLSIYCDLGLIKGRLRRVDLVSLAKRFGCSKSEFLEKLNINPLEGLDLLMLLRQICSLTRHVLDEVARRMNRYNSIIDVYKIMLQKRMFINGREILEAFWKYLRDETDMDYIDTDLLLDCRHDNERLFRYKVKLLFNNRMAESALSMLKTLLNGRSVRLVDCICGKIKEINNNDQVLEKVCKRVLIS